MSLLQILADGRAAAARRRRSARLGAAPRRCHAGCSAARMSARQPADVDGDRPVAEIAVGLQLAGRHARDRRVAGQIDRIGDDRRRRVGLGRGPRQHGHGIGDAEREAAAARPVAAPDVAMPRTGMSAVSVDRAVQRRRAQIRRPGRNAACAGRQMKRDVAAIVDVGAARSRPARIAASTSSATAPATAAIGVMKSVGEGPQACLMRRATGPWQRPPGPPRFAESGARSSGSSRTSPRQHVGERRRAGGTPPRLRGRRPRPRRRGRSGRAADAAGGRRAGAASGFIARPPVAASSGQGLRRRPGRSLRPLEVADRATGRMKSPWPPSAA